LLLVVYQGLWVWAPSSAAGADVPLIAAHRGSTIHAPENTLAAIRWAAGAGADLVETDLRITRDGALVLLHDERVNRTTTGHGSVHDLTLSEVRSFDAGAGQKVPTLDEALTLMADRPQRLLLDVKDGDRIPASQLIGAVTAHGLEQRVLVGVRSVDFLQALERGDPRVRTLAMIPEASSLEAFVRYRPDAVRLWARWVERNPKLVDSVRASGAHVWIMAGGRRPASMRDLVGRVDGIITDYPLELRRMVGPGPALIHP
jgi:glycerophosphoryl diester phosphodiesterase